MDFKIALLHTAVVAEFTRKWFLLPMYTDMVLHTSDVVSMKRCADIADELTTKSVRSGHVSASSAVVDGEIQVRRAETMTVDANLFCGRSKSGLLISYF